ncbi:Fe-S cluster assembly ATPase SufC [Candidatus Roizmanbacteria bacterium]|nr:Fe-S cluster assembly ATPase SufC [Candidatus Roizmanbacteria bacterium]
MLQLHKVGISVGEKHIIQDFSFSFEKGKTYAIMGPNGSGKSTLASSIMGLPPYTVQSGSDIKLDRQDILSLDSVQRAKQGIFLSYQSPISLNGVTVSQLLHMALLGKKDPLAIRQEIRLYANELGITDELLRRPLNEGASGGEKKKLEVLQAAVLEPSVAIFDEIDTGVDVDSLKTISEFLKKYQGDKTYIIITHYNHILHYLPPDEVLVLGNGTLKRVGDSRLAREIEEKGYEGVSII